jgi:hypothetical protein
MPFDDGFDDGEAETTTSSIRATGLVGFVEPIENPCHVFRHESFTGVADEDSEAAFADFRSQLDLPARWRVAQCVCREILEHLFQPAEIAIHRGGRGVDRDDQLHTAVLSLAFVPLDHTLKKHFDLDRRHFQRAPTGFETSQVEQVADHAFEALDFGSDDTQVPPPRLFADLQLRHLQRVEVAANRGQGRHQFVRNVGQQLTPCFRGIVQL